MYDKILVPVDGSPTSNRGLQEAISLARLCGARLRLLHVVDLMSYNLAAATDAGLSAEVWQALKDGGEQLLAKALATVQAAGLQADSKMVENLASRVSELVITEAGAWGAGLIVLGTHGRRGIGRLMLGSDAEQIVRHAPVPVLLVRDAETPPAG
jgi:nucleotide-binding universal stress UspA family protein